MAIVHACLFSQSLSSWDEKRLSPTHATQLKLLDVGDDRFQASRNAFPCRCLSREQWQCPKQTLFAMYRHTWNTRRHMCVFWASDAWTSRCASRPTRVVCALHFFCAHRSQKGLGSLFLCRYPSCGHVLFSSYKTSLCFAPTTTRVLSDLLTEVCVHGRFVAVVARVIQSEEVGDELGICDGNRVLVDLRPEHCTE